MKNLKLRSRDESGAVLIVVALVTVVLLILSGGGIMLLTLYGSQREMQKAADQAALASAAALPLLNPGQALDALPMDTAYQLTEGVGLDSTLMGLSNIPDPRAVACAYAERQLRSDSARLVAQFGDGLDAGGSCAGGPWNEGRVNVALGSLTSPLTRCVDNLTNAVSNVTSQLQSGLNGLLSTPVALGYTVGDIVDDSGLLSLPLVGPILQSSLNAILSPLGLTLGDVEDLKDTVPDAVTQLEGLVDSVGNLEALAPALMTPEVTVTVTERVSPPLMSLVTGSSGVEMTVDATAQRRLKNAIVLPGTPLFGVDLNSALNATKPDVMGALTTVNDGLNEVMGIFGGLGLNTAGCQDLLSPASKLYQDIDDIYDPPSAAPYTGRDLVSGANDAIQRVASNYGTTVDALAGEAFLVIAEGGLSETTLSNILGTSVSALGLSSVLNELPIPALDVAVVAAHNLEGGDPLGEDTVIDAVSARGLFTATLVD